MTGNKTHQNLILLILISTAARLAIAAVTELGNDEVYYAVLARYPGLSYFDHPGMVGWMIWLSTLGNTLWGELFVRLIPVLLAALDTYLIYLLGKKIFGERAGFYTALLFTGSVYCSVICGIFAMPDAPLVTFWILSLLLGWDILSASPEEKKARVKMLLFGLTAGLAALSKYHGLYLWGAFGLYVLLYDRRWLRTKELYLSALITLVCLIPILYWNAQNGFASFTFHGSRVTGGRLAVDFDAFLRELVGGIAYNNPVNYVLILIALVGFLRRRQPAETDKLHFLLLFSLPLIALFLTLSLFHDTLPHWSGPAYLSLLVLAGGWFAAKRPTRVPAGIKASPAVLAALLALAVVQIRTGFIPLGSNDPTLDMYGWRQLGKRFEEFRQKDGYDIATLYSYRWFPAAHLDYYVGRGDGRKLLCEGELVRIHQYRWINRERGPLKQGQSAYLLIPENDYERQEAFFAGQFGRVVKAGEIPVTRGGRTAKTFLVYRLENKL